MQNLVKTLQTKMKPEMTLCAGKVQGGRVSASTPVWIDGRLNGRTNGYMEGQITVGTVGKARKAEVLRCIV